jgi:hypothetical protein
MFGAIERDDRGAGNHKPVFGALMMLLIGESLPGINRDPLDLGERTVIEDDVIAPRASFSRAGLGAAFGRKIA